MIFINIFWLWPLPVAGRVQGYGSFGIMSWAAPPGHKDVSDGITPSASLWLGQG